MVIFSFGRPKQLKKNIFCIFQKLQKLFFILSSGPNWRTNSSIAKSENVFGKLETLLHLFIQYSWIQWRIQGVNLNIACRKLQTSLPEVFRKLDTGRQTEGIPWCFLGFALLLQSSPTSHVWLNQFEKIILTTGQSLRQKEKSLPLQHQDTTKNSLPPYKFCSWRVGTKLV